jgi:hypothetical protein
VRFDLICFHRGNHLRNSLGFIGIAELAWLALGKLLTRRL